MNPSQTTAAQDLSSSSLSTACRCRKRRRRSKRRNENPDEKIEVDKKIVALQKIVPGGERLPVDELFQETAEYIFALESQVEALRFLAAFVHTSDKAKRKLGA
ncbi:transcription factor PAR1-like [Salvia splendens]|uniref:transcription factor PAR1-like n=1 Tax=Salvia splendens TaxID=180675 RepID=UPI001C251B18|nr:transcription factor PAR1-like [Salvia splendens]